MKKYNNIKDINKIYPWKVLSLKPNVSLKNPNEVIALTQKVYAEAANQPSRARKLIPRVALNRVGRKGYPKTLLSVLGQRAAGKNKYAFSCANDGGNHPWKQIMGKIKMNSNDRKIVQDCFKDVISVLNGEETCICRENDIEAYHDTSTTYEYLTSEARGKKDRAYWQSLEEVDRAGAFIAYAKRN